MSLCRYVSCKCQHCVTPLYISLSSVFTWPPSDLPQIFVEKALSVGLLTVVSDASDTLWPKFDKSLHETMSDVRQHIILLSQPFHRVGHGAPHNIVKPSPLQFQAYIALPNLVLGLPFFCHYLHTPHGAPGLPLNLKSALLALSCVLPRCASILEAGADAWGETLLSVGS